MAGGWLAARLWEARARELGQRHSGAVAALDTLAVLAAERRAPDTGGAVHDPRFATGDGGCGC